MKLGVDHNLSKMWSSRWTLCAFILLSSTVAAMIDFEDILESLKPQCSSMEIQCRTESTCIPMNQMCDGKNDCPDQSDEVNCGRSLKLCSDPNFLQCHDKKCIPSASACNGNNDCANGEDEKNCHPLQIMGKCSGKFHRCKNKQCIPFKWICDGKNDCSDGEDEGVGCTMSEIALKCEDDEFKCKNHQCIPKIFVCDGAKDCDDNSDEMNCPAPVVDPTTCTYAERKFLCQDKSNCIDIKRTCDSKKDCSDGSDESATICSTKDVCTNCTGRCIHTITGPMCVCPEGFDRLLNNSCADINECSSFGTCDQICTNTNGSYKCSCNAPYELDSDGHTCRIKKGEAVLYYAASTRIGEFFLSTNVSSTVVDQIPHTIDVATAGRYIYWCAAGSEPFIMRADSDGSSPEPIVTAGLERPEGLAVDWITMNVYFTDAGKKSISVCSKDGYMCIPLHNEDIDKPRAISLSPMHRLMFWTDWGKRPLIGRSGMDGSDPIVFVGGNIHWPNGVTVDEPAERIYWVEAKLQQIQTIKFDGSDRRMILADIAKHPYSIAIFENQIYWSDSSGFEILACNKFTGRQRRGILRAPGDHIFGLHVHHHLLKRRNIVNPCSRAPCTHLCLLSPNSKNYSCACPEGQMLKQNGYECMFHIPPPVLLVAFRDHLYAVEYHTLGRQRIEYHILGAEDIISIAYDSSKHAVIMFDGLRRSLVTYSLRKKTISTLPYSSTGLISSLQYDELGNNLYWCDWYTLSIDAMNLATGSRMVIVSRTQAETPYDLALAPELDFMFVSLLIMYERIHIYRYSMSGSLVSKKKLLEVGGKTLDVKLHYSRELRRLFFTSSPMGTIESVDVNGENRRIELENELPILFTVADGMLFWTEKNSAWICSKSLNQSVVYRYIQLSGLSYGLVSLTSMVRRNPASPCHEDNGGCSDLCLVSHQSPTNVTCACPSGLALGLDDHSCLKPRDCASDEFQCLTGECISTRKRCDGHEDCLHGDDERKSACISSNCPPGQFLCADRFKCVDQARRCDGIFDCVDKSDEICNHNCTREVNKFFCISGECIDFHFRCDNKVDCKDGHDETDCYHANCSADEFKCLSGQCIPKEWECDSEPDCVDGSDEYPKCRGTSCFKEEFRCDNLLCVDGRLTCNGIDDCGDNSDEAICRDVNLRTSKGINKICNPHNEFYCPFTERPCLPLAVRCNGTSECRDGSDELNCTASPCIDGEEFYCSDAKKCIPSQWLCDHNNDCGDNSDEDENNCHLKTLSDKKCTGFACKSGECVSLLRVCDGIPNCQDRSDEGEQCGIPCQQFGCEYKCLQTPHGPQCQCPNGFSLDLTNNKTCLDVNECDLNMCSQQCQNTNGSYICSCYTPHYILRSDHVSCKARGDSPIFVVASDMSLDIFSNNLKHKTDLLLGTNLFRTIRAIDVDSLNKSVYILLEDDELWRVSLLTGHTERMTLPRITSFAHDWITQNIYYIENHVSIRVVDWNSTSSVQLYHTNGTNYMWALAIDPYAGYIFWFESHANIDESSGRIMRADATGANPKIIVSELEYGTRQLVVDSFGQHVYWINRIDHMIHRSNYDGTHGANMKHFDDDAIAFTFFENSVYIVTRHLDKFGVKKCKIYGTTPRKCETVKMSLNYIHYLSIMQENRQRTVPNPCEDAVCAGYCITSPTGLMCKQFDGGLSPIVKRQSLQWRQENSGVTFGTVLAYLVVFGFIFGVGFLLYSYRNKSKTSFLQRFHFHNSIYDRTIRPDSTYSEHTSIINAEVCYENALDEEKHASIADVMAIPSKKNPFLETLHEEATSSECGNNSCTQVSTETLIKI